MSWLGDTAPKRVLKRYRLLRGYLKRPDFAGVMLSRQEVKELVEALMPLYEEKKKRPP